MPQSLPVEPTKPDTFDLTEMLRQCFEDWAGFASLIELVLDRAEGRA